MKLLSRDLLLFLFFIPIACEDVIAADAVRHPWEVVEISLSTQREYRNPYTEVECWVRLEGPDFDRRVYGFWDGGQEFRVRVVATQPGYWKWTSGSNQAEDAGLNGKEGAFEAKPWSETQKQANPNRRGMIRATSDGHALQYADGTPFFFLGDTWWAASTWRYPLTGHAPDPSWKPGPDGFSFENALAYRKGQGYNLIALIAAFPNWNVDEWPERLVDQNGVGIRQAWEKSGRRTAKDMHDEAGQRSFAASGRGPLADFDSINPAYFQSLDRKIAYMNQQGFVPFLETVRRDHGPSWRAYFSWPGSFVRYLQYIAARYGAFNLIFSPLHLDWIIPVHSLSGEEFNFAINAWHQQYGRLPFGQPVTVLIDGATHKTFGPVRGTAWLTMHSVGNSPRNHGFYPLLEEQFELQPPQPTANLEAYYPGWNNENHNTVAGERPKPGSDRDHYFGRTQAWGSVFSGGLAGHIYGSGAYCGNTAGEPPGVRPYIWEALAYESSHQMQHLKSFILSEGSAYQQMKPSRTDLDPAAAAESHPKGLDGWSFFLRNAKGDLGLLYFENASQIPAIRRLIPGTRYSLFWYSPETGRWLDKAEKMTDSAGNLNLDAFPDGGGISRADWALKIQAVLADGR
jgi:hypothetical protein